MVTTWQMIRPGSAGGLGNAGASLPSYDLFPVANNAFTAQGSSVVLNPSPDGSYGSRHFGTKCVRAANIDRIILACGDGENGNYASSWWEYNPDTQQFTRTRPDPSNLVGHGVWTASANGFQDFNGCARGDNRFLAYHPGTGTVWLWGGNFGANSGGDAQDATWFGHANGNVGVYIYDTATAVLTKPATTGMDSTMRHLSGGPGWDPNVNKFLQVGGESGLGGFSTTDTQLYEIDPSTGPGGTATRKTWTADGVAGPLNRMNISHQFVYHSLASKWLVFGGHSAGASGGYTTHKDCWMYDATQPVSTAWTRLADMPTGRAHGFAWYDSRNNVVIVCGGVSSGSTDGVANTTTLAFSWEGNTWTDLGIAFSRRTGGGVYDPTRNAGFLTPGEGLTDTDVYSFRYAIP